MENPQLNTFFARISSGDFNCLILNLDTNGALVAQLQADLQNITSDNDLEELVERQKFHKGSWTRFNILVTSFLKYCKDVNPWSLWESSDLIFTYYQDLTNCLLNDNFPANSLVPLFQDTTEYAIVLAKRLDSKYRDLGTRQHQFLAYMSSVITKLFNSIKPRYEEPALRFQELPKKQQILLYTANKLNNIYMHIDSPSSCANIFKNVKPKSAIQSFSQYPIKEQIEYRYLLGRYYLLNHRVSNGFHQLNCAFSLLAVCVNKSPPNTATRRNLQRILNFLLPAAILFGKTPSWDLCRYYDPDSTNTFEQLVHAVKTGNMHSFNVWLAQHEHALRSRKLLILLLEKIPLLVYRNLIRRTVLTFCFPSNTNKIPYTILEEAVRISLGSSDGFQSIYTLIHTPENVPNLLESLVNLGLMKANCFPISKQCVFPKSDKIDFIFPAINEKLIAFFPLNNDDTWLDD
ncbi:LADA_0B07690g1_1 [Lachancea dasiensis]|uniref:LADA_0B07690g1_1 n=1 Tax=Lachancea dasiensis TaxID=1072105 RepID=A0A1G4IU62_9SACH|nr:LADA_0B07690g1_1 [Lachancea dasiensis]